MKSPCKPDCCCARCLLRELRSQRPPRRRSRRMVKIPEALRYEAAHIVRPIPSITIPPGATRNICQRNRFRVSLALTVQLTTSGGAPTNVSVLAFGSSNQPGQIVAILGQFATWPSPMGCCIKAIIQSRLDVVNNDVANSAIISVVDVLDASGRNET